MVLINNGYPLCVWKGILQPFPPDTQWGKTKKTQGGKVVK